MYELLNFFKFQVVAQGVANFRSLSPAFSYSTHVSYKLECAQQGVERRLVGRGQLMWIITYLSKE
jgi:hypothetical protein